MAMPMCALLLSLSACTSLETRQQKAAHATSEVRIVATPKAAPHKAITNFSDSLRCMDTLFSRYGITNLTIGSQDIPDQTEVVTAGTKDMLISALSTMSIKSRAIRFVALGQDLEDITRFHTLHKNKSFQAPDFFIRGAITQVDRGVVDTQASGGLSIAQQLSLSASKDKIASIITLDMNVGLVSNLQILPGINSSNSVAVIRRGVGADLSGTIRSLGAVFQIDFTESEGLHHAVRTLLELGAIELMGRLTQVPYWECVDVETTNTFVQRQIEDWYKALDNSELTRFVQAKLSAKGLYNGPIDGEGNNRLKTAVALYKSSQGLIANSSRDYMLYYSLISDPTPVRTTHLPLLSKSVEEYQGYEFPHREQPSIEVVQSHTMLEGDRLVPLELILTTDRGERPVYFQGESATFTAKLTVDAYLYCYYQPNSADIIKIYPNRFAPNSHVAAGQLVVIPGDDPFKLRMDRRAVNEKVLCMASYNDIEQRMPFEFKSKSLQPLSLPRLNTIYGRKIASLDDIYDIYKSSTRIVPLRKTLTIQIQ